MLRNKHSSLRLFTDYHLIIAHSELVPNVVGLSIFLVSVSFQQSFVLKRGQRASDRERERRGHTWGHHGPQWVLPKYWDANHQGKEG